MGGAAAQRLPGAAGERHDGEGEQRGLGEEQGVRGRGDPVQRREDDEHGVEVVAEQVEPVAAQRGDGGVQLGVRLHGLLEDAEVVAGGADQRLAAGADGGVEQEERGGPPPPEEGGRRRARAAAAGNRGDASQPQRGHFVADCPHPFHMFGC